MSTKKELVKDIENLLNNYDDTASTTINPAMLEFMDIETLKSIIGTLLDQKEQAMSSDTQWLEQFKSQSKVN